MFISNIFKEAFMPFGFSSRRSSVLLGTVVVCALLLSALATSSRADSQSPQTPQLVVDVKDTVGAAGTQNSVITVTLNNYTDSIAAFTLWLRLNRPDIIKFQVDTQLVVDTTYWKCTAYQNSVCIDSIAMPKDSAGRPGVYRIIRDTNVTVGNISKTGTIIANWDMVSTRSIAGNGTDILVNAIANTFTAPDPLNPPPLAPSSTQRVLFKLLADVLPISDTVTDRTVKIMIEHSFLDKFIFSKPNGTAVGVYGRIVPDTDYFHCTAYLGGHCTNWEKVSAPPYESTFVRLDTIPTLDTTKVIISDGQLTATSCCSGKTGNVNLQGIVDLSDLSLLIAYLTRTPRPTLPCPKAANINAMGIVDLSDLSLLIAYLTVTPRPTLPNCPL